MSEEHIPPSDEVRREMQHREDEPDHQEDPDNCPGCALVRVWDLACKLDSDSMMAMASMTASCAAAMLLVAQQRRLEEPDEEES